MAWMSLINNNMHIVFVGLNPGIRSFKIQCFYAHPTNRFWKLLHEAGFTTRQLLPEEHAELLAHKIGLLDLVHRPTVSGSELSSTEYREGSRRVWEIVQKHRPLWLAANGLVVGRWLCGDPTLRTYGECRLQSETNIRLWILPSSSGRAARRAGLPMTYYDKLAEWKKFYQNSHQREVV